MFKKPEVVVGVLCMIALLILSGIDIAQGRPEKVWMPWTLFVLSFGFSYIGSRLWKEGE